jgi:hypothetical protein
MSAAFDPEARRARMAARQREQYGEEESGTLSDLQPGDFVVSCGGVRSGREDFRRYRIERSAESVEHGSADGRNFTVTVTFFGLDPLCGVSHYPVRFRRLARP